MKIPLHLQYHRSHTVQQNCKQEVVNKYGELYAEVAHGNMLLVNLDVVYPKKFSITN